MGARVRKDLIRRDDASATAHCKEKNMDGNGKRICQNCHIALPKACKECPDHRCVEARRKAFRCSVGKQLAFDFFRGNYDLAARA